MQERALNLKQISNYLIVGLFVFAVTSVSLTYWVFPSYAAPTVTTFFSCETSDGCGYRYNNTLYLAPLPNNMTQLGDWTPNSLVYEMNSNETIIINGSAIQRGNPNSILTILYTPSINGTMGLHIVTDLNGQSSAESLEIEVNASSLVSGNPTIFSALIDRGASTGGMIHAFHVSAVGSGSAEIEALGVFSGIIPIHQHSGASANMDRALLYTGSFSDVTAAFTTTGNDTSLFVSNGDSVYVGHASKFSEIQFNLDTLASGAGVKPIFEFSTGAGGWTLFNPIDATDGFRDDGGIDFEPSSLTGWAIDTVSGFNNLFWIRINRTQVGLGTVPIEDLVQIVVGTEFTWDASGNVQIFGLNVTQNLIVTGTSTFNGLTDFNAIVDGNNNAFNNIGASCNDLGNPNAFCASNFSGIVDGQANNFNNLGNVGNDLQAVSNTLIQTSFSGEIITNGNKITNSLTATGNDLLLQLRPSSDQFHLSLLTLNIVATDTFRFNLSSNANIAIATWIATNQQPAVNNTLTDGADAVRYADTYSVNDHAKVQITGILIEDDIKPLPSQYNLFEDGDVVCAAIDLFYFKLCDQTGDELILGVVHMLERRAYDNNTDTWIITHYEPKLMIEGPKYIKICSPVVRGELLIAGNNGCAKGVNSLQGTTTILGINIPNRILARDRAFAIAWEDSNGLMAAVHVRAA